MMKGVVSDDVMCEGVASADAMMKEGGWCVCWCSTDK